MLDASWLPDVRRDLYEHEGECMTHISSGTFEEKPFTDYFLSWESYMYILSNNPNEKDWYDAKNLPQIAEYYNEQTRTTNYYDPRTGKKGTQSPKYYSSSSSSSSDETPSYHETREEIIKKYAIIGGGILLAILLLRGCAHGETMDTKKAKALLNKARVECMDQNYTPNGVDTISPESFPVRRLTIN